MRVLLVASPSSFTDQIRNAFKENNAEVFYLNDRENILVPWPFKNNNVLWRIMRRIQFIRVLNNCIFAGKLLRMASKIKPDLVFFSKAMIVKSESLTALRAMGIKTANWTVDNINNEPYRSWFLNNYKFYDYFFIFDSGAKELVKNESESKNIFYLPLAVEPETFRQEVPTVSDVQKYSCDVCFVGALYPEREKFLNVVKSMGVNLKIFGWSGWTNSSLAASYHGPLNVEETVKLYNCAKICLNMNLEPAVNGVNFKTFEIPAAGGFQLSDYRKDLDGLFEIGKEIDCFRNEDELVSKIRFYLGNNQARQAIAVAGRERVLHDHVIAKRMGEVLKIISS